MKSLSQRCLELTAFFETSLRSPDCYKVVTGNFDGQGLSAGALQWNIGQGSLQPLLSEVLLRTNTPDSGFRKTVEHLAQVDPKDGVPIAAELARFKKFRKQLGEFMWSDGVGGDVQVLYAEKVYEKARYWWRKFGLTTEAGVALMYDIVTQNGGFSSKHVKAIMLDYPGSERERLERIAAMRSSFSQPRWRADVLSRKMCIATGAGVVHGINVDTNDFGIGMVPVEDK